MEDLLAEYSHIDLVWNFCQRCSLRNLNSWSLFQKGTVLHLICNYIIGTDWRHFELVVILDMSNFL